MAAYAGVLALMQMQLFVLHSAKQRTLHRDKPSASPNQRLAFQGLKGIRADTVREKTEVSKGSMYKGK